MSIEKYPISDVDFETNATDGRCEIEEFGSGRCKEKAVVCERDLPYPDVFVCEEHETQL